jgi:hypothetical protein
MLISPILNRKNAWLRSTKISVKSSAILLEQFKIHVLCQEFHELVKFIKSWKLSHIWLNTCFTTNDARSDIVTNKFGLGFLFLSLLLFFWDMVSLYIPSCPQTHSFSLSLPRVRITDTCHHVHQQISSQFVK